MKLFAVVFGAAVAASMVSALGEAQDVIATGEFQWIGNCGDYQIWETTDKNDGCSVGDDALLESPCLAGKSVLADDLGVSSQDIKFSCCGQDGSLGQKCELLFITELTCPTSVTDIINNLDCNKCLYRVFAPPTPTPAGDFCACENGCCDVPTPYEETMEIPGDAKDKFDAAVYPLITDERKNGLDFGNLVQVCGEPFQRKIKFGRTDQPLSWCIAKCCDCCHNSEMSWHVPPQKHITTPGDVTICPPRDEEVLIQVNQIQSFAGATTEFCWAPISNSDEEDKYDVAISNSILGAVFYHIHDEAEQPRFPYKDDIFNNQITLGCSEKLGGGNTAPMNQTQYNNRESYSSFD